MSDLNDLLSRCQRHDRTAFDELFQRFTARVYRLAVTILRDEKDAEDAVQESLLKVYRNIDGYRGEAAFDTWLTTITVNVCRDHLRRQKLRRVVSLDWLRARPDQNQSSVLDQVDRRMEDQALWGLVDRMDDRYRLPLLLVYREQMPPAQAAQALGLPLRTLYARLKHAYTDLGSRLPEAAVLPLGSLDGEKC